MDRVGLHMLLAFIPLLPACGDAPAGSEPQAAEPSPKRVQGAIDALDRAFRSGDLKLQVETMKEYWDVVESDVFKAVMRELGERGLGMSAIESMGQGQHPGLLDVLHQLYHTGGMIKTDTQLHAALLQSIGRHASESSIDVLGDDRLANKDPRTVRARMLGLARIRTERSARALFGLFAKREAIAEAGEEFPMAEFRIAALLLTGVDQGDSPEAWQTWWREHGDELSVPAAAPPLPQEMLVRWDGFWAGHAR